MSHHDPLVDDLHPYHCTNTACGGIWSADQLLRERFGKQTVLLCPTCRLGVKQLRPEPGFWARIPTAFRYPFQGDGPWILFSGTVLFALLTIGRRSGLLLPSMLATLLLVGIFGLLLIHIVQSTAADETRNPDWPDITGLSDLFVTTAQILGSLIVVFLPFSFCSLRVYSLLVGVEASQESLVTWGLLALVSGVGGLIYYPMTILAIAMFGTIGAIKPSIVLPAMIRTRWHYLAVVILLGVFVVLRMSVVLVTDALPLWPALVALLPGEALALYTLIVSARLLGLLYRSNQGSLGWFET